MISCSETTSHPSNYACATADAELYSAADPEQVRNDDQVSIRIYLLSISKIQHISTT